MAESYIDPLSQSALELSDSVTLPSRPEVLELIAEEMEQASPDLEKVVATLNLDAALFGAILQVVNSPYFGLKTTVTSIKHAVMLLGLRDVYSLARTAALRSSLGKLKGLDRFWDSSVEVAALCRMIAIEITDKSPDDAYTLGMFHDAGVPLMMLAFPKYRRVLKSVLAKEPNAILEHEIAHFGCHRYHVGHRLAVRWFLPEYICQSILFQSVTENVLKGNIITTPHTPELLAVLTLAKHISNRFRAYWRVAAEPDFNNIPEQAAQFLKLNEAGYVDLQDRLLQRLQTDLP